MNSFLKKSKKIYNNEGFSELVKAVLFKFLTKRYDIPSRRIGVFNGVAVRGVSIYSKKDIFQEHEAELILAIRNYINNGEKAVVPLLNKSIFDKVGRFTSL